MEMQELIKIATVTFILSNFVYHLTRVNEVANYVATWLWDNIGSISKPICNCPPCMSWTYGLVAWAIVGGTPTAALFAIMLVFSLNYMIHADKDSE